MSIKGTGKRSIRRKDGQGRYTQARTCASLGCSTGGHFLWEMTTVPCSNPERHPPRGPPITSAETLPSS